MLGGGGEGPGPDIGAVVADRGGNYRREVGVEAQELRTETVVHAEHVGNDENLAVDPGSGPDADHGDAAGLRRRLGERWARPPALGGAPVAGAGYGLGTGR